MAIAHRGIRKQTKRFRAISLLFAISAIAAGSLAISPSPTNAAVTSHWIYLTVDWTYLNAQGQGATHISLRDIGGNCDLKDFTYKVFIPDPSRGISQTARLFVARDGGSCQYEGSNSQYLVTLYQHNGKTAQVKLNVTQYDGPSSGYKATCYEARGISCTGDNFGKAVGQGGVGGAGASVNLYFWPIHFAGADIGPTGYVYCTEETNHCEIPQSDRAISIAYGAHGKFTYKNEAANFGSFTCGLTFFGHDPIFGTVKACFYKHT